VKNWK